MVKRINDDKLRDAAKALERAAEAEIACANKLIKEAVKNG